MVMDMFATHGGVATTRQLLDVMSEGTIARRVRNGSIFRIRHGVYSATPPETATRLAALDLVSDKHIVACMNTAADLHGFSTEPDDRLHILDPGVRIRPTRDVMVHQRIGAPLSKIGGRLATAPAWTAVEIGRSVRRPRTLAVLDAALRSQTCDLTGLAEAVDEQKGRRGIVRVREMLVHADGRAESPMESEARLTFIDGGLPLPELQFEIVDLQGRLWRADFAWPEFMLVAEYESMAWHASSEALRHDRMKVARLQECGWMTIPLVVDDVRRYPAELVARIAHHMAYRAS